MIWVIMKKLELLSRRMGHCLAVTPGRSVFKFALYIYVIIPKLAHQLIKTGAIISNIVIGSKTDGPLPLFLMVG